ncbi:MAG TPA: DUF2231 domain-containing protein [Acidobacteriaceae bacterium]|nr:DUF2231 domain-containing protein [Acidobacteriaceae bacterium]
MQFPPIPSWDAMHPLLIHFPIVLLLLVPLFILIAAAMRPRRNSPYMLMAALLLVLGTASLFAAASSGEEAAELADRSAAVNAVLMAHQHLASRTEIVFSILSVLFVAIVILLRFRNLPQTRLMTSVVPLAYLCLYAAGVLYLVNTAHAGGRLVHEFGVHAELPPSDEPGISGASLPDQEPGE